MTPHFPASLRVIGRSFVDWWDSWLDMVLVTALWFIAQVTVVLGPPATFGYYYAVHSMLNGQAIGVPGLIEGARKYFGKAWLWGLVNLLAVFTITFSAWFYLHQAATWSFYAFALVVLVGYLWICTQFYALPYFMELENKDLYTAMKNGLFTTLAAPFFTPILIIISLLVVVLSFVLILPLFLGLPALVPIMGFRSMYDRLVAFRLREREKTPREIEMEQASKIVVPTFDRKTENSDSVGGDRPAVDNQVADSEGQVEQKK